MQHFVYHVIKKTVHKLMVLVEVEVALFREFNGESNTNGKTICATNLCRPLFGVQKLEHSSLKVNVVLCTAALRRRSSGGLLRGTWCLP